MRKLIKKNFNKYLDIEKNNYFCLIKLLEKIAINYPDINIVFRPHPHQDIKIVKKRFSKRIKNLKNHLQRCNNTLDCCMRFVFTFRL